jgi:hypothetical protein
MMVAANCFVTFVFQPRFTLPMWELTIMSLTILVSVNHGCSYLPITRYSSHATAVAEPMMSRFFRDLRSMGRDGCALTVCAPPDGR